MVPALNAYGRYLQRTFYQPINTPQTRRKLFPVWIWEEIDGTSVGGADSKQKSKKITVGNLMLYFSGFLGPSFTYRVENSIWSGDQATNQSVGPETMWLAYSFLHNDLGHLLIGNDYPGPVPAFLANPSDYANAFALRHLTVGEHSYNLMNDRLTFRFDYDNGPTDVQVAWRGGSNNPLAGTPSDFAITPGSDKAFQWLLADAPPTQPYEFGAFGIDGQYYPTGHYAGDIDNYNGWSPYFDVDPNWLPNSKFLPGIYGFYYFSHDSNPGVAYNMTLYPTGPNARDAAVELLEPVYDDSAVVTARDEYVNNGLGEVEHDYSIGTSFYPFAKLPFIIARFQVPLAGYSSAPYGRPEWEWALQFETPLSGPLTSPFTRTSTVAQGGAAPSGADIFATRCSACHGSNGQGVAGFPALAGNADVLAADASKIIGVVEHGAGSMPAYGSQLSSAEIAAVLTYIRSAWGNNASPVTETQVGGPPHSSRRSLRALADPGPTLPY